MKRIPILHGEEIIEVSVRQYTEAVRARLKRCFDFESRRQFVLDYIEKIVSTNDHVAVYGSVPVKLANYDDADSSSDASTIGFSIEGRVSREQPIKHSNVDLPNRIVAEKSVDRLGA
jgi:hypothetical protein